MKNTDKTGIFKHTITVTILADLPSIDLFNLSDLAREMEEGDFMGITECVDISDELTVKELTVAANEMGGDVEFFLLDEDYHG